MKSIIFQSLRGACFAPVECYESGGFKRIDPKDKKIKNGDTEKLEGPFR